MFQKMDTDGNGTISLQEFSSMMAEKLSNQIMVFQDLASTFRDEFKKADYNHTGVITKMQFKQVLTNLRIKLTETQFRAICHDIDVDGNGMIDIDEFMDFMVSNTGGRNRNSQAAIDQIRSS